MQILGLEGKSFCSRVDTALIGFRTSGLLENKGKALFPLYDWMESSSVAVSFPSFLLLVLSSILRKKTHAYSRILPHLKRLKSLLSFRVPQIFFKAIL